MEKTYEILAKSKEGHGYRCTLTCEEGKQQEALRKHIDQIGWAMYGYRIESSREVEKVED